MNDTKHMNSSWTLLGLQKAKTAPPYASITESGDVSDEALWSSAPWLVRSGVELTLGPFHGAIECQILKARLDDLIHDGVAQFSGRLGAYTVSLDRTRESVALWVRVETHYGDAVLYIPKVSSLGIVGTELRRRRTTSIDALRMTTRDDMIEKSATFHLLCEMEEIKMFQRRPVKT
jgi:hypothetical protein